MAALNKNSEGYPTADEFLRTLKVDPLTALAAIDAPPEMLAQVEQGRGDMDELKRRARVGGDWQEYLGLHGGHEALDALLDVADDIDSPADYWQAVADLWMRFDAPSIRADDWREVFTGYFSVRGIGQMMNDAERQLLDGLPDPLNVFRGFTRDNGDQGFAWSLDRTKAEWFACNYHDGERLALLHGVAPSGQPPRLAIGTVAKPDVLAYLGEREESEILVMPESVQITEIVQLDPNGGTE